MSPEIEQPSSSPCRVRRFFPAGRDAYGGLVGLMTVIEVHEGRVGWVIAEAIVYHVDPNLTLIARLRTRQIEDLQPHERRSVVRKLRPTLTAEPTRVRHAILQFVAP